MYDGINHLHCVICGFPGVDLCTQCRESVTKPRSSALADEIGAQEAERRRQVFPAAVVAFVTILVGTLAFGGLAAVHDAPVLDALGGKEYRVEQVRDRVRVELECGSDAEARETARVLLAAKWGR